MTKGQVLGTISATNLQEYKDGAHLHFQTMENGAYIDPEKYLDFSLCPAANIVRRGDFLNSAFS